MSRVYPDLSLAPLLGQGKREGPEEDCAPYVFDPPALRGVPSCVAKRVAKPIRNREARSPSRT